MHDLLAPVAPVAATATATATAAQAPRPDLYVPIHKALRCCMADVLTRLGRLDPDEDPERVAVLDEIDAALELLRHHVHHENDFVHTAIEARRPGGARQTADDHLQHLEAIAALEDESRSLRHAAAARRPAAALQLYRHLAVFVGENLLHMQVEETQNNAALWALYGDAELFALHDRLLAGVAPATLAQVMRWMGAALSVPELTMVFADMQAKAPAPAFEAMLGIVRTQLDDRRWAQLARALGRPPVPGLVTV